MWTDSVKAAQSELNESGQHARTKELRHEGNHVTFLNNIDGFNVLDPKHRVIASGDCNHIKTDTYSVLLNVWSVQSCSFCFRRVSEQR